MRFNSRERESRNVLPGLLALAEVPCRKWFPAGLNHRKPEALRETK